MMAAACLWTPAMVAARPVTGEFGAAVYLEAHYYTWREFAQDGAQLLRESGPRPALGIRLDNFSRPDGGWLLGLAASAYGATVDYAGQTLSGTPFDTRTRYSGNTVEATVGYRVADRRLRHRLDLVAALGLDRWARDIQSGTTAGGVPVSGYREDYEVRYGRLGVGAALRGDGWQGRAQGGVKAVFDVTEDVPAFQVRLAPEGRSSTYFFLELGPADGDSLRWSITLFYDSFLLDDSPVESSTIGNVYQPRSRMELWGTRFTYFF